MMDASLRWSTGMNPTHSRRAFLEDLGIGSAGLALGGYLATSKGYAANESLGIGVIGCGGRVMRGRVLEAMLKLPGLRINALCDVFDDHLKAAVVACKNPKVFTTLDHHELLARKDVDVVVIGTPDHWHAPMTIDAVKAGKDVYVEKPVIHSVAEGRPLIEAVRASGRVVQVGAQQTSMPQFIEAKQMLAQKLLGEIRLIDMSWARNQLPYRKLAYNIKPAQVDWKRFCGNAPTQEFNAFKMRNWRWFWDFGGGTTTDLMVHWLDATYNMIDLGTPRQVVGIGHHNFNTDWETPDTFQLVADFPGNTQLRFLGTFVSQYHRAGVTYMGELASLYVDRGRYEFRPETGKRGGGSDLPPKDLIIGQGKRGADFFEDPPAELLHMSNWLECVRDRSKKVHSPVENAVAAASVAWLGNDSYRQGKIIRPA
jgi:predicted dehydrogenase